MRSILRFAPLAAWLLAAPAALAQTNDAFFSSWHPGLDQGAPRAAGMAGAFVAVADDSSAVAINPAGIASLAKSEVQASLLARGASDAATGLRSRTSLGYVGGAGLISRHWAIGGFVSVPHDRHTGVDGTSFLDSTITDGGVALAWQPDPRLSLGARLNATHLRLQAAVRTGTGVDERFVGMAAGATRITGDAGLLFAASDALRIGLVYRRGATWQVTRVARDVAHDVVLDDARFELRAPSSVSGGFALRVNEHLLLSAQGDLLLLDTSNDALAIVRGSFQPADYTRDNALDGRAGAEVSMNLGALSVQLRSGVARETRATFRYSGSDTAEAALFSGQVASTYGTAGVSLVAAPGAGAEFGAHASAAFGTERTVFAAGVSLRF